MTTLTLITYGAATAVGAVLNAIWPVFRAVIVWTAKAVLYLLDTPAK